MLTRRDRMLGPLRRRDIGSFLSLLVVDCPFLHYAANVPCHGDVNPMQPMTLCETKASRTKSAGQEMGGAF
jgi:hypothetical protein